MINFAKDLANILCKSYDNSTIVVQKLSCISYCTYFQTSESDIISSHTSLGMNRGVGGEQGAVTPPLFKNGGGGA